MTPDDPTVKTRIGELTFIDGYPAGNTLDRLYSEMDFQRAVQCYLWAVPLVSFVEWQREHEETFGARDGDMVVYTSYRDKLGLLTANATTPYVLGFVNLDKTGPLVIDYPAGATAGAILDRWQRLISDMGETGPDQGEGARYLIQGPDQSVPDTEGYIAVQSRTNNIFHALRVLVPDPDEGRELAHRYHAYPYSKRDNPPATRFVTPDGREWTGMQPRGLAYWERLAKSLHEEPVEERDRMLVAMLKPLGIAKGRPFQPDSRQKNILTEAAVVGEAMAKALAFDKRFEGATVYPGRHWEYPVMLNPSQETEHHTQLDERTAWFYEAVTLTGGMTTKTPGVGQAYLSVHKDKNGDWLEGGNTYRLRVPPNVPVQGFWSMTLYDVDTRCFIQNKQEIADRSSRMDLATNDDGSVDLYFGPKPPQGHEQNWIPTVPNRGWFAYFRLYAPSEGYFDKSWQLPDIEKVAVEAGLYRLRAKGVMH